jgi:hypothetical protein
LREAFGTRAIGGTVIARHKRAHGESEFVADPRRYTSRLYG